MNLKKFLFLSLAICLMAPLSYGQISGIFTIGPKIGFNYTTLPSSSADVSNNAGKAGFQAGIFARIGNKTYLQPEVLIGTNSATFTFNSSAVGASGSTQTSKFTTLDIPVLLGHKLISLPLVNIRAMVGPDFVTLLKKPGLQVPNAGDYNYKDFNVGAIVGLGVDAGNFTIDARYNFGLSSINSGFGQRMNMFNLSLGLKLI